MLRDIVIIDEDKCDGCGLCTKACAEGAIRIVNGKARLEADFLCDGMGACLGHCPRGAIRIEKREAEAFDEQAVAAHLKLNNGCPGSRFAQFERATASVHETPDDELPSELTHWPVQLRLLNPMAPMLKGTRFLVAADCVPIAYADFHRKMLRDHAVAIACPKLDDTSTYIDKLTEIIRLNRPAEITVAHMEVPCCTGILMMVLEARRRSGINVPVIDVAVGIRGDILHEKEVPLDAAA